MVGQVPQTPPPGFGSEYADRQAQQQRLEQVMVGGDLNRRAQLMGNIISNAPNIAALSGVGAVDQLANQFVDAEAPIFNNAYGQQGDVLRRQEQVARIAAANRSGRGGGRGGGGGKTSDIPAGANINPDDVILVEYDEQGNPIGQRHMNLDTYQVMKPMLGDNFKVVPFPVNALPSNNLTNKPAIPNVSANPAVTDVDNTGTITNGAGGAENAARQNAQPIVPGNSDPNLDMILQNPNVTNATPNGDGSYTVELNDGSTTVLEF